MTIIWIYLKLTFLHEHAARYRNAGRGNQSYLPFVSTVQLMGERVLLELILEHKIFKYFSISVDSTPDVTHVDQLTLIMRYVSPDGKVEERFLKFLTITSHTGESLCSKSTWR